MNETIEVSKRFNDGDYSFTEIKVTRGINSGDTINEVVKLKLEITAAYHNNKAVTTEAKPIVETTEKSKPIAETTEKSKPIAETETEPPVITEDEAKKAEAAKKKAPAKRAAAKKSVLIPYDREIKAHKEDFAVELGKICPTWKDSPETKAAALELSKSMHGKDMYGPKGGIVVAFILEIEETMKKAQVEGTEL